MKILGRALCMCVFLLCLAHSLSAQDAQAQQSTGTIVGTVHDSSGALIPSVTVTITDSKGQSQTATTDDQGSYTLASLAPGTYAVSLSIQGFKDFNIKGLVLAAGKTERVDISLEVSASNTSLEVEGKKAAEVETENPQLSGTITQKETTALMLNGRNFTQLITLAPGVSNQTGQDEALVGAKGSVKYSVNGGRVEYNNFDVDGSDVLNPGLNGSSSTLIVYPSLDAIQEVKVLTSNYGAQYGRSASGTVLVTTKSGGNKFHGDGYEFIRNEFFNARNYFDQTTQAPLYRRNDFGFTLGGPLEIPHLYNTKREKTFFFFSEEARLERTPQEFNQAVPSDAERAGQFSDVCPFANAEQQVYFTRAQFPDCPAESPAGTGNFYLTFPGNQVPTDPNAAILMGTGIFPAPNSSSGCNSSIRSCFDAAVSPPTYWREELLRLDHNFSQNVRGTARYTHDAWNTQTPIPQWGYIQNSFPTVENDFFGPGLSVVAHVTQIVTTSFVQDLVFSYTTDHISLTDLNGPGGTWQRPAGLTMGALFPCPYAFNSSACFGGKIPGVVVGGTNAAYGGDGFAVDPSFEPYYHSNPTYSFGDDLIKTFGKHSLGFGVQVVMAAKNEVNPAIGAATGDVQGIVSFSNVNSFLTTGNSFADFLEGNIRSFQQDSAQAKYYNRYTTVEPYVQDDWKVTPKLTVNVGVRLSLFGTWHEKYATAYNWEPQAFSTSLASQAAVDPFTGVLLDVPSCLDPTQPSSSTCSAIPLNPANPDPRLLNGLVQCGAGSIPTSCMANHIFNPAPRVGFAWDPEGNGMTSIRGGYGIFFEHGTGNEANTGSLEGSAPLVLDMTENFTAGYECIGSANGSTCGHGAFPLNVTEIPQKAVWPYVQQWNLSVQHQLTPNLVASAAYVGSKGTHLTAELQVNQLAPVSPADNPFIPGQPLSSTICSSYDGANFSLDNNTPTPITISTGNPAFVNLQAACYGIQAVKLFPDPNSLRTYAPTMGQVFSLENVADSTYNAMQFTLRRSKGPLSLELAYSYSHSIDDSSDRFDSTFVNSYDLHANTSSSNFDQRHLLNMSYVYDFSLFALGNVGERLWDFAKDLTGPLGSRSADPPKPKVAAVDGATSAAGDPPLHAAGFAESWIGRDLMNDWEFSGITTFQSGTPFSVINGGSASTGLSVLDNAGVANGTGAGSYPDVVPRGMLPPSPLLPIDNFTFGPLLANPNEFAAPEGLTFGDAGRNFMNNPSRLNFDMAVLKHIKTSEGTYFELRAEAFNIFNHTQFRIFNPDRGNQANNVISCYAGPENTAGWDSNTPGGTECTVGNSFLHPIDAHRPRTIQFGLKFFF
jgi:hypothetical protein